MIALGLCLGVGAALAARRTVLRPTEAALG
jgi:hypothetical protein